MSNKLKLKRGIGILLNLIIGINFLLSAYAKTPTIETLGWTIAEFTPFDWTLSEWLARLLVGLEYFLGFLFITQLAIKKLAIPLATGLLIIFSVYLSYILAVYGNEANCGCYGEMIKLSTTESLVKNAILLLLLWLAYYTIFQIQFKYQWIFILFFAVISFVYPFYKDPPASIIIFNKQEIKEKTFPIHRIVDSTNYLASQKKIVAMVSPTCKYCKKAAKRMGIIKRRNPEIPMQMVMAGHRDHLSTFLKETRSQNIPLIFIDSIEIFKEMNGARGVPTIKWVQDSTVIKKSTYYSLSEKEIRSWLKE